MVQFGQKHDLNTARYVGLGNGITTDGIYAAGNPGIVSNTETFNGTSWTEVNNLNTARITLGAGGGTSPGSSQLAVGGAVPSTPANVTNTESWDGTSWTEVADLAATNSSNGFGISSSSSAISMGGFAPTPSTFATVTEEWNVPTTNSTLTAS
jgi:hypothetical protein